MTQINYYPSKEYLRSIILEYGSRKLKIENDETILCFVRSFDNSPCKYENSIEAFTSIKFLTQEDLEKNYYMINCSEENQPQTFILKHELD